MISNRIKSDLYVLWTICTSVSFIICLSLASDGIYNPYFAYIVIINLIIWTIVTMKFMNNSK